MHAATVASQVEVQQVQGVADVEKLASPARRGARRWGRAAGPARDASGLHARWVASLHGGTRAEVTAPSSMRYGGKPAAASLQRRRSSHWGQR